MSDNWIRIPKNSSYENIPQGIEISRNPKDYISDIQDKEQKQAKQDVDIFSTVIKPVKVKINDVSKITNKFKHGVR